jgi:PAS domain S-box-containing protein
MLQQIPHADLSDPAGWHPRAVVNEMDFADLTLNELGIIRESSDAAEQLFGFLRQELLDRHIALLLPQFEQVSFRRKERQSSRLCFLCHIGSQFRALCKDGSEFRCTLFLTDLNNPGVPCVRLFVHKVGYATQDQDGKDI